MTTVSNKCLKPIVMAIGIVLTLVSCAGFEQYMTGLIIRTESEKGAYHAAFFEYEDLYIRKKVPYKMPESEFVALFEKDTDWADPQRPYIVSRNDHCYTVRGSFFYTAHNGAELKRRFMARFFFESEALERYEYFDYDFQCITIRGGQWVEATWGLQGYWL